MACTATDWMNDPIGCMAGTIREFGGAVGGMIIVVIAAGIIAITALLVWSIYKGTKAASSTAERGYASL